MLRTSVSAFLILSLTGCAEDLSPVDEELAGEASALSGDDIGVIPEGGAICPDGMVKLHFDNENDKNNNQRGGWIGDWRSAKNTELRFCRVSSSKFKPAKGTLAASSYAVLKLGKDCPPGSVTVIRYFDCEDDTPTFTGDSPAIRPSRFIGSPLPNNLEMHMCVFEAKATGSTAPFPELGFPYGVMGGPSLPGAKATGFLYTDDEDDDNNNHYTNPDGVDLSSIVVDNDNTRFYTVRVRD